jgi:hypothetical protein
MDNLKSAECWKSPMWLDVTTGVVEVRALRLILDATSDFHSDAPFTTRFDLAHNSLLKRDNRSARSRSTLHKVHPVPTHL